MAFLPQRCHRSGRHKQWARILVNIPLLVFITLSTFAAPRAGEQTTPQLLKLQETLDRVISAQQTDTFTLELAVNQYAQLIIDPKGINLSVKIVSSDLSLPVKYENQAGPRTRLVISIIATVPGPYVVEVRPRDNCLLSGKYSIRLDERGNPTSIQENRALATSLVVEGNRKQRAADDKSRAEAIPKYEAAAKLWQEIGVDYELANTFEEMGKTYAKLNNLSKADEYFNLAIDRRKNDEPASAYTRLYLADAYNGKDLKTALIKYEDALKAFLEVGDRTGQILAQTEIGLIYLRQDRSQEALGVYQTVRELSRVEGDRCGTLRALNALGGVYDNLLQPDEAIKSYQLALEGWHELGDLRQEANTVNNIGLLYDYGGQWNEAFINYKNALDLIDRAQKLPDANLDDIRRKKASFLLNLGSLYVGLGDYDAGLGFLQESLRHRDPGWAGSTLMWLGYSYALKEEPDAALTYCERGLEQTNITLSQMAQTYTVMGMAYHQKNQVLRAIDYFKKALEIQQNPKQPNFQAQAITLDKLGRAYLASGDLDSARRELERARSLWHGFRDSNGEAMTLGQLAKVESAAGNLKSAVQLAEHAITLVEPLRTNLFNQQLRSYYYADKVDYFELLADLNMRLEKSGNEGPHVVAAFEASERQRARGLLDILDANIDPGKLTDRKLAELIDKRRSLQRTIFLNSARQSQLRQSLLKFRNNAGSSGNEVGETERKLAALDRDLTQLISERQRVEQVIKTDFHRYSALMAPQPLTAAQIKSLLDDDTLLLQFSLGQDRSYLWLVTTDKLSGFALPGRAVIEEKAQAVINALRNSEPRRGESAAALRARRERELPTYLNEASKLSQMLFGNLADRLNKKRLVIVADGALLHLPFSALPLPRGASDNSSTAELTPLVSTYEIVNLPSASVLQLLRQTARPEKFPLTVAVFSDPVFERDDTRIPMMSRDNQPVPPSSNNSLAQLLRDFDDFGSSPPRLRATAQEAQAILQFAPRGSARLESGLDANRKNLTDKQLARFRIVHLATHGMIDENNPELSGILLSLYDQRGQFSQDGYLRLTDIYELNLPIDLVVLSACRTALGKRVRGEGLIGLTRAFMFAGASKVVASLWRVDDQVTAELMKRFYQGLLKNGLTPAEALQAAQVSMSKDPRWHHPYFWSGFVLQGDWR